ncbi:hypothetical protein AK88_03775 [Plasmodium fragile]|uniref:Uncharacterized protein n=1 Tax=Plasmodium fragile TaxID=5857 RepID=A0A0D9QHU3_PLAFR|nr:uncharacterized protein AK88_03775 [Plasmodium fragile]KJP86579.1 hypothetical protein AK88_03775 [Plasmodium fragile]
MKAMWKISVYLSLWNILIYFNCAKVTNSNQVKTSLRNGFGQTGNFTGHGGVGRHQNVKNQHGEFFSVQGNDDEQVISGETDEASESASPGTGNTNGAPVGNAGGDSNGGLGGFPGGVIQGTDFQSVLFPMTGRRTTAGGNSGTDNVGDGNGKGGQGQTSSFNSQEVSTVLPPPAEASIPGSPGEGVTTEAVQTVPESPEAASQGSTTHHSGSDSADDDYSWFGYTPWENSTTASGSGPESPSDNTESNILEEVQFSETDKDIHEKEDEVVMEKEVEEGVEQEDIDEGETEEGGEADNANHDDVDVEEGDEEVEDEYDESEYYQQMIDTQYAQEMPTEQNNFSAGTYIPLISEAMVHSALSEQYKDNVEGTKAAQAFVNTLMNLLDDDNSPVDESIKHLADDISQFVLKLDA